MRKSSVQPFGNRGNAGLTISKGVYNLGPNLFQAECFVAKPALLRTLGRAQNMMHCRYDEPADRRPCDIKQGQSPGRVLRKI